MAKTSSGALETRISAAVTLHLEEFQAKEMIEIIEKRIIDTMDKLQKLEEPKNKAFDEYEKLQNQYDTVNARFLADKRLIENLSKYQNNIKQGVDIRIIRGESHNDMKPREQRKHATKKPSRFFWMEYAEKALKEENRFVTLTHLWDIVGTKFGIFDIIEKEGLGLGKLRWGAINNCWLTNAESTKLGRYSGKLVEYKGLIGLKEWATDDFIPKPEYMRGVTIPTLQAAS